MSEERSTKTRREFMKEAFVAGAAAVVTAAQQARGQEPKSKTTPSEAKQVSQGYRVTEHIKDYYKTAAL